MGNFLLYFLKVNVVLSVLFALYWVLFRNEKFFQLNRSVLLGVLLLPILLPFVPSGIAPANTDWQHAFSSICSPSGNVLTDDK